MAGFYIHLHDLTKYNYKYAISINILYYITLCMAYFRLANIFLSVAVNCTWEKEEILNISKAIRINLTFYLWIKNIIGIKSFCDREPIPLIL